MPELPEVETIKLQLQKYLVGHKIENVKFPNVHADAITTNNYQFPIDNIKKTKVIDIRRFGKVTVIDLDNKYSILIHVKLTGQIIYRGPNLNSTSLSNKVTGGLGGPHTLVVFELDRGGKLYYNDVRRFGWIRVVRSTEIEKEKFISKLGPDILQISSEDFQKILSKTKRNIKVVLMDQSKIGGVGNIYANDALWLSRIDPRKPAGQLDSKSVRQLYEALHTVLKAGLKYGGASELAFVTPDGAEGQYQNHTLVYGHRGENCKSCNKNKIEKFFLGGRGTYVCPVCQS